MAGSQPEMLQVADFLMKPREESGLDKILKFFSSNFKLTFY